MATGVSPAVVSQFGDVLAGAASVNAALSAMVSYWAHIAWATTSHCSQRYGTRLRWLTALRARAERAGEVVVVDHGQLVPRSRDRFGG